MYKKYHLYSIILFSCFFQSYAQLCEGNLGDPVVEIDFGSGIGRGDALDTSITAFTYSASGNLDEGQYTIANTTSGLKDNAWHTTSDHTGNANGYMMVINSAVLANEGVFYTYTVNGLCSNTTYEFSAWLMNIMNPSAGTDEYHPDVTFRISDTSGHILGSYNTGDIAQSSTGYWQQYGFFFTLEADTEVVITILNSAPSAHPGNDIALDDIAFRPCGPTIINTIENEIGTSLEICQNETVNYNFQSTVSSGYTNPQYQWQYSDDFGTTWIDIDGETSTNYVFTSTDQSGIFFYRLTVANGSNINSMACRITSDEYIIEIFETPEGLTGESEQIFCTTQNATISDIEVSSSAIWYNSATEGNILNETTNLTNGTTYYAARQTINGCESDERFAVMVTIVSPSLVINNISAILCDTSNDDTEIVDLTAYESEITTCNDCLFSYFTTQTAAENYAIDNQIISPTNFEWQLDTNTIYSRIDSSDNCYQIAEISLNFGETPTIPIDDFISICNGNNSVIIDAGYGFNSYIWSTGETSQTISVSYEDVGSYWVTVTKDYGSYVCSSTKEFQVKLSNTAIISSIDVQDWTDNSNTITVIISDLSVGEYEYSLDNITYQESNEFINLLAGEYIVYIKDKNGCGIVEREVYVLNYPKYFTPNDDGQHDTWYIKHSNQEPTMTIKIFDRYGKILKSLSSTSSWDGTYNGYKMPTNDYWFLVTRADGRNFTGHFTLKR